MASFDQDINSATGGRCHVIPVHGTWGAGFWRSVFWDLLPPNRRQRATQWRICVELQEVGVIIHPTFTWSGKNSHYRRIEAGKELAAYVAALKLQLSDRLFLVTHSHGGNVALYALNHPGTERVEGITFLATPFLLFQPFDYPFVGLTLLSSSIKHVGFWFMAIVFFLFAWLTLTQRFHEMLIPALQAFAVFATIGIGLAGVIMVLAGRAARRWRPKFDAALQEIPGLCEKYQPPVPEGQRVLIIRKTSDEIPLTLEVGHWFEWLFMLAWRALSGLWRLPSVAATALKTLVEQNSWSKWALVLLNVSVAVLFFSNLDTVSTISDKFVPVAIKAMGIIFLIQACFFVLILGLNIARFGRGPARWRTPFIRVTSEATPLGLWEVETFPATGFAHSEIHEDPEVAEVIAKWLFAEERRKHHGPGA